MGGSYSIVSERSRFGEMVNRIRERSLKSSQHRHKSTNTSQSAKGIAEPATVTTAMNNKKLIKSSGSKSNKKLATNFKVSGQLSSSSVSSNSGSGKSKLSKATTSATTSATTTTATTTTTTTTTTTATTITATGGNNTTFVDCSTAPSADNVFARIAAGEFSTRLPASMPSAPPEAVVAASQNRAHGHVIAKGRYRYSPAFQLIRQNQQQLQQQQQQQQQQHHQNLYQQQQHQQQQQLQLKRNIERSSKKSNEKCSTKQSTSIQIFHTVDYNKTKSAMATAAAAAAGGGQQQQQSGSKKWISSLSGGGGGGHSSICKSYKSNSNSAGSSNKKSANNLKIKSKESKSINSNKSIHSFKR